MCARPWLRDSLGSGVRDTLSHTRWTHGTRPRASPRPLPTTCRTSPYAPSRVRTHSTQDRCRTPSWRQSTHLTSTSCARPTGGQADDSKHRLTQLKPMAARDAESSRRITATMEMTGGWAPRSRCVALRQARQRVHERPLVSSAPWRRRQQPCSGSSCARNQACVKIPSRKSMKERSHVESDDPRARERSGSTIFARLEER